MPQIKLVKFTFKLNGKSIWLNWCDELTKRSDEVIETLKNEGVFTEACFISTNEDCVYYFMEVENFEKVKKAVRNSTFLIDTDHQKALSSSLEKIEELNPLFYFKNNILSK